MKKSISTFTMLACFATAAYGQNPDPMPFVQSLRQVSAAGNGVLYGLNDKDQIFVWEGAKWLRVEGELRQISAGSPTEVWGVNALNKVYRTTTSGWQQMPGSMKMVAVAKGGGAVVAIDLQGRPFAWNQMGWTPFPNAPVLDFIAIGRPSNIYGLGKNGEIYRWWPATGAWRRINGALKKISIAADGTIAGVNDIRKGWLRKDSDIQAEIAGTSTTPKWTAADQNVTDLEIIDMNNSIVVDRNGLLIERSSHQMSDGTIALDGEIVVDGSFLKPAGPILASGSSIDYNPTKCRYLSGNLKIPGLTPNPNMDKPLINQEGTCVRMAGLFHSYSTPEVDAPTHKVSRLMLMDFHYGKKDEDGSHSPGTGAKVCAAKNFRSVSHRSWVEFRLPDEAQGGQITIPAGAYNNYVFPACNRVYWDNLTFTCNAGTGWTRTRGSWDADGLCHGFKPESKFVEVGNR